MNNVLQVEKLDKKFQTGEHTVHAVRDASFGIPQGSVTAIVGASGSGKSTLLALLGSLDVPDSGTITMDEQEVTKLSDHALIKYRNKKIGFVFQAYELIPNLTALENVMLPMEFAHSKRHEQQHRAEKLLHQVGLNKQQMERTPRKLSGGEQQRVAIARALANAPRMILADEPTGNLDSNTGKKILELLKGLAKDENTAVIIVTHDQSIASQADRVLHIKDGKIA
ncbi:MAG: ABC transporter ATP-binding protein [Patescibacteria group bacterium]|jgi:putative ABC transport system ATP-binding protein